MGFFHIWNINIEEMGIQLYKFQTRKRIKEHRYTITNSVHNDPDHNQHEAANFPNQNPIMINTETLIMQTKITKKIQPKGNI